MLGRRFDVPTMSRFDVVRTLLGSLLLLAAALKGHELATAPVLSTGILDSRWFLIVVVQFELLAGLWLCSGNAPRASWLGAIVGLSLFASVSLGKAVSGADSCGCFGNVAVNPWLTFMVDVALLAALAYWRPNVGASRPVHNRFSSRTAAFVVAAWLLIGTPLLLAMGSYTAATLAETGEVVGDAQYVVAEPAEWIGQQFPLAGHIDIGGTLRRGLWLVLLYRHECPACQAAASGFGTLAKEFSARTNCPRVSIVECPPYSVTLDEAGIDVDALAYGRLNDTRRWRIPTPVALLLDNGKVGAVFDDPRDLDVLRAIWGAS